MTSSHELHQTSFQGKPLHKFLSYPISEEVQDIASIRVQQHNHTKSSFPLRLSCPYAIELFPKANFYQKNSSKNGNDVVELSPLINGNRELRSRNNLKSKGIVKIWRQSRSIDCVTTHINHHIFLKSFPRPPSQS